MSFLEVCLFLFFFILFLPIEFVVACFYCLVLMVLNWGAGFVAGVVGRSIWRENSG